MKSILPPSSPQNPGLTGAAIRAMQDEDCLKIAAHRDEDGSWWDVNTGENLPASVSASLTALAATHRSDSAQILILGADDMRIGVIVERMGRDEVLPMITMIKSDRAAMYAAYEEQIDEIERVRESRLGDRT